MESLNPAIHNLLVTLFLVTLPFPLWFHSAILSRWTSHRLFAIHLELALWIFLAWKFHEGLSVITFLALLFISSLCIPWPLWLGPHAPTCHLHGFGTGVTLSGSLLGIVQKQQAKSKRRRKTPRENLCASNCVRKQITLESIFCWFTPQKCQQTSGAPSEWM